VAILAAREIAAAAGGDAFLAEEAGSLMASIAATDAAKSAAGDAAWTVASEITWDAEWDKFRVERWTAVGLPTWYTAKTRNSFFVADWDLAKLAARHLAWDAAKIGKVADAGPAWDAVWAAAMVDASAQTWQLVRSAAEVAARDAAYAEAWRAAKDAAVGAAGEGVELAFSRTIVAAKDAAKAKLAPTVAELQRSALELVDKMIAA
jgi:hypothetical protein